MADVIDLITPPGSPEQDVENVKPLGKRKATAATDAVCILLDSSDDDELEAVIPKVARGAAGCSSSADDGMVEEVAAPPPVLTRAADGEDDDDLEFIGRTGHNALEDFPHSREHCVAFAFAAATAQQHCPNCFCMVCDVPARACAEWLQHCSATHASAHWQALRKQKQQRLAPAPAPAPAPSAAPPHAQRGIFPVFNQQAPRPAPPAAARPASAGAGEPWSCERVLREVQQVWPAQADKPEGLLRSVQLRPYQKQALAFMKELEKTTDPSLIGIRCYGPVPASVEKGPPVQVHGGWLTSEVGMGKTMVCISLVLAHPCTDKAVSGVTVVLTANSLLGQWKDEIGKYARASLQN